MNQNEGWATSEHVEKAFSYEDVCSRLKGWDMHIFVELALLTGFVLGRVLK